MPGPAGGSKPGPPGAPVNRIEQGGYVVVLLLGSFSKGARTIHVAFDKDGLVAGFVVVGPPTGPPPPA